MIKSIDRYLIEHWQNQSNVIYRLHSRFNHAINWVNTNGEMVTFLTRDLPNAPNTLLIDEDYFSHWDLSDSSIFMKNAEGYFIDQQNISNTSEIEIWSMNIAEIHNIDPEVLTVMNEFLDESCEAMIGIEAKIYEKLDENYQNLIDVCHDNLAEKITLAAKQSIGLGLGLTPSGDDRLVGFLLGCYMQSEKNQVMINALKLAIETSADLTNEISYAMLNAAREGRFNDWLLQLAEVISQNNLAVLPLAMERVFGIGSRSGGDMLKGLILSLEMNLD